MVDTINGLEASVSALSDAAIKDRVHEIRLSIQQEEQTLDKALPEVFALVRETAKRLLNMRHFDVQLIGGMVLHQGRIAEMGTGEGKTLMATLPAVLNALMGDPVYIVTVNPYLANRDAQWMGPVYEALGLRVAVIVPEMEKADKLSAYDADIIYATNNELGFDYLRDNMAYSPQDCVQKRLSFAIIDEVDSILIDEARTPLIISGMVEHSTQLYGLMNEMVKGLRRADILDEGQVGEGDFTVEEKHRQVHLTEEGQERVEGLLKEKGHIQGDGSLYHPKHINLLHHVHAALRAHHLFKHDVDYIVSDDRKIVIVDEHTGRTMPGRRWSEGLHQAVEAKEGVPIQSENQTLASITFQNYFRQFDKLAGMTGTADTEAYEFHQIYGLDVTVIPTNRPVQRVDESDLIYLTQNEKYDAIVEDITERHQKGQPILVGTISIENSEYLSKRLKKAKIPHNVLNAKFHAQEAEIIAQAGQVGVVTIATNMAGRGTDIVLGGNWEALASAKGIEDEATLAKLKSQWEDDHQKVLSLGGLHILGTERHESRRIDNQLRGRSGRQGDPGSSQFFLSLEDALMRIFASDRVKGLMRKLGVKEGEAITHPMVNRSIENAQRKVEGHHFDTRKQLLEYDNVANDQRKVVYAERRELMELDSVAEQVDRFQEDVLTQVVESYVPPDSLEEQWDLSALQVELSEKYGLECPLHAWLEDAEQFSADTFVEKVLAVAKTTYQEKRDTIQPEVLSHIEKSLLLHQLDVHWKDHLAAMDYLRQSIHLRGYAQKDPKQEYKRESFILFQDMLFNYQSAVVEMLLKLKVKSESAAEEVDQMEQEQRAAVQRTLERAQSAHTAQGVVSIGGAVLNDEDGATASALPKVGRNEPCPCGSEKKYKHCHGKLV